jgi:uncharacterized protein YbjT (DUF2867 family)
MILITGATGNVGRPLVATLAAEGDKVTAVARHITDADVPAGVRTVQADLAAANSALFDGADAVFLLTAGDFLAAGGNLDTVLAAAKDGGVRRVVLLSSLGVATGRHPAVHEDAVRRSGLAWTILRPGGFASNVRQWAGSVREHRLIAAPFADVALPVVDPFDVAEVAAAALRSDNHAGAVYQLTGPAAISPREQSAVIAETLGARIRFVELTREQARAEMVRFMPESVAEGSLDILGAPTVEERRTSPDVERVLGRPPHSFAEWVSRNLADFR